ncbi:hydroxymethylbilane synthase [Rubrobacter taiwanensis]|uniref:Porphobilinogen deaminase n=1 Tax=Rubrobacter taiwanensis TaxID=185139 RepID=A0A4R1BSH5_9ACTN|nr:hydroxymethylbilane synthase [Rubrobacter taiwanensis]TCJ20611.1 hydroxymethylbilane synthase [Rubrobacter taiwanensis]
MKPAVLLGTRGSRLALVQAESVAERLRRAGIPVEISTIRTTDERLPETPLAVIDRRDVFTRQLDEALLAGGIDLAVHSLKDVPTGLPEGIEIVAVTERGDPSDVLVSPDGRGLDGLPEGAVIATSSLRRRAQLLHYRPDLRTVEIRGNVDTRVRKVREGYADALILARAGLERLGLRVRYRPIPFGIVLPAAGQGSLGVAVRWDSPLREPLREALNHEPSERAARAERAFLRALEGGCRVPVGVLARTEGAGVVLQGVAASPDGGALYRGELRGERPEETGVRLAQELLERGAGEILEEIRGVRR